MCIRDRGNSLLIGPSEINPANTDIVYLGGTQLWVYDDSDGTLSSIKGPIPTPGAFITKIEVDDQFRAIWIGYSNGTVEFSENGGATWSGDVSGFNVPNGYVTDIDIRPFGPDALDVLVTFGGYRPDNLWRVTENGGTVSWTDISLDFDMHVNTITHHPVNFDWIYIGTDVGIFASEDYGVNWSTTPVNVDMQPEYRNEGPIYTEVTDLFWEFNSTQGVNRLCAATFGRGIYRSSSVLTQSYVDRTHTGFQFGTLANPYDAFLDAEFKVRNSSAPVIFLEGGTYDEISSPRLFDKELYVKSQASTGALIK